MPGIAQHVRFCSAPDGASLAYATMGRGTPLVRAAYWLTHIEYDGQSEIWRPFLTELARNFTVLRYDERGCGLSDRAVADISFDAWLADLEAVVSAAGLARFALLGMSQGASIAIAYAVRHPERVSKLVIYGGYARGRRRRGSPDQDEEADLQERAVLLGWGRENPAFRQIFTSQFMPDSTPEQIRDFDAMQRISAAPDTAARILRVTNMIDVTDLLPRVRLPTLVMHSEADARIPFQEGRLLASLIPGAHFVPLPGRNHVLVATEPAYRMFFDELNAFLHDVSEASGCSIEGLTARERQLLELLARGCSNDEIALELKISQKTVRNVVSIIFDKLGVASRSHAIVKAREAGFGAS